MINTVRLLGYDGGSGGGVVGSSVFALRLTTTLMRELLTAHQNGIPVFVEISDTSMPQSLTVGTNSYTTNSFSSSDELSSAFVERQSGPRLPFPFFSLYFSGAEWRDIGIVRGRCMLSNLGKDSERDHSATRRESEDDEASRVRSVYFLYVGILYPGQFACSLARSCLIRLWPVSPSIMHAGLFPSGRRMVRTVVVGIHEAFISLRCDRLACCDVARLCDTSGSACQAGQVWSVLHDAARTYHPHPRARSELQLRTPHNCEQDFPRHGVAWLGIHPLSPQCAFGVPMRFLPISLFPGHVRCVRRRPLGPRRSTPLPGRPRPHACRSSRHHGLHVGGRPPSESLPG